MGETAKKSFLVLPVFPEVLNLAQSQALRGRRLSIGTHEFNATLGPQLR